MGRMAEAFKAMGDETRLRILKQLLKERLCVNDICKRIGTTQPNISQHISVLKRAGLIEVSRRGKKCCCRAKKPKTVLKAIMLLEKVIRHES
ncbi:MAG: metalloregulator ArsR/SmtB family transcription factor [Candidatus Micrarchaeia archaeon]